MFRALMQMEARGDHAEEGETVLELGRFFLGDFQELPWLSFERFLASDGSKMTIPEEAEPPKLPQEALGSPSKFPL